MSSASSRSASSSGASRAPGSAALSALFVAAFAAAAGAAAAVALEDGVDAGVVRQGEREELLGVMEKASKPAVSRTQATFSLGSSGNAFANSTLTSLVHRERTDVLNAQPFEAPEILTLSGVIAVL